MKPTITRWTSPCGCVFDREISEDKQSYKSLLVNELCKGHTQLASKVFRHDHKEQSDHVLELIEEAKAVNLKAVEDAIANEENPIRKRQYMQCRNQVLAFNNELDIEWQYLVSRPHAFDHHIHDKIDNELKNKAAEMNG